MDNLKKELSEKLNSGKYNFSSISIHTDISRYWLNDIRDNGENTSAPMYILVALNEYFKA